jgi:hypothetical protein
MKASGSQFKRFSVRSDVSQGSHLGPLLLILFINDVFSCFKSLRLLLYADDLKIFFPVAGNSDFASAQATIDNGMQFNLGKCNSISFTRSRFTRHFQYELSGHRSDSVVTIFDLGIVLDSKPNFTSHIDSLVEKASRMLSRVG